MQPYIITVSRQFGSMGRSIAQELANLLDIQYYDRDIVEETAKRMGITHADVSKMEEGSGESYLYRMYPLGKGIKSIQNEIFEIQKNIILDLAKKESCIIVGRCADAILSDYERLLSVYIYASKDQRLKNCIEKLEMSEKIALKSIDAIDKAREAYRREYGREDKSMLTGKHLLLNSSRFGIDGAAQLLAQVARDLFKLT